MEDFVYWRHPSVPGIKIEEITEGEEFRGPAWLDMARQIYCENGKDQYREIGHFQNGAPFLFGSSARISITHCTGLLAVATLPETPDVSLGEFSEITAMGIDAERADRAQVLKIRERFLSESELEMIPADDIEKNILAWTIKEACYKAVMGTGLDWRKDITILTLPLPGPSTPVYDRKEFPAITLGSAEVTLPATSQCVRLDLYTYRSDAFVITLAFSPRAARFHKQQ